MQRNENLKLRHKIQQLEEQLNKLRPSKGEKRKCPFQHFCNTPKRNRKTKYTDLLQYVVNVIPKCTQCEIKVKCSTTESDLTLKPAASDSEDIEAESTVGQGADHTYCNNNAVQFEPETESRKKFDDRNIYDREGNFTTKHVRKAVLVTDSFRISNDAYHEIRTELSGHMPPVGQVKHQKAVMSEEIPYKKHPTVSS